MAAFGSFLFPTLGRFLLPLVALLVLLVTGDADGTILVAAVLSLAITTAACVAGWFFLRRESAARWLGAKAQRPLSWIRVKRKRNPIDDWPERASALREQALVALREGWRLGSVGVAANLFFTYVILLVSLRFVGVSSVQLSAADAFTAFAVAFWAGAVVPITGSGLGVVDAVLITMLIESSAASDDSQVRDLPGPSDRSWQKPPVCSAALTRRPPLPIDAPNGLGVTGHGDNLRHLPV